MTAAEILPWLPPLVTAAIGLLALGKAKGMLDAVTARVNELKAKLNGVDTFTDDSLADRARLNAKVVALEMGHTGGAAQREAIAQNVQKTREEAAAAQATAQAQHLAMTDTLDGLKHDVAEINRRLAEVSKDMGALPCRTPHDK